MRSEKPWLDHYPAGVPAEIDMNEFASINDVFDAVSFREFEAFRINICDHDVPRTGVFGDSG